MNRMIMEGLSRKQRILRASGPCLSSSERTGTWIWTPNCHAIMAQLVITAHPAMHYCVQHKLASSRLRVLITQSCAHPHSLSMFQSLSSLLARRSRSYSYPRAISAESCIRHEIRVRVGTSFSGASAYLQGKASRRHDRADAYTAQAFTTGVARQTLT